VEADAASLMSILHSTEWHHFSSVLHILSCDEFFLSEAVLLSGSADRWTTVDAADVKASFLFRWLNAMSAAVAAAKKQRVPPVDEMISDAALDVTDSGSTLHQIEQYVIVC